jgi:penicillin amidase
VSAIRSCRKRDTSGISPIVSPVEAAFPGFASRREFALVVAGALASDVQMRTLGLRRSAEKGLGVLSGETRAALKAYAEGVNAWLGRGKLPGQYATVSVTKVAPWTEVDSLVVIKTLAFSLSFDLDIDRTTAVRGYEAAGFDGRKAVFGDLMPFAPFSTASPVGDSTTRPGRPT